MNDETNTGERPGKWLGEQTFSARGFPRVLFEDSDGVKCRLQASSLADYPQPGISAICLGVNDASPAVLWSDASKVGIFTNRKCGWVPYPIPKEVNIITWMHLRRDKVKQLINHLQAWLDSDAGEFE